MRARKYSKAAGEKIGKTMHEFKRGKLKSGGSGKKVTSRKQAIAIGISQAHRAGYKVPPWRGHATMSLDARVRAYLSTMRPGTEIDGWGMARALKIEPIAASHALERAQKAGLAVSDDGRWFGPASASRGRGRAHHATRKTPAQLDKEIAEFTAEPKLGDPTWEREWSELLTEKHSKARMPTIDELARAFRYVENEYDIRDGRIDMEQWAEGLAFGRHAGEADAKYQAKAMLDQVSTATWLRAAERANYLAQEQGEKPRYLA